MADVVVTNGGRQAWLHKGVSSFWITWRMDNFIYIYIRWLSFPIDPLDRRGIFLSRREKKKRIRFEEETRRL